MPSKAPHGIFELAPSASLGLTSSLFYSGLVLILVLVAVGAYLYWRKKKTASSSPILRLSPWESLSGEIKTSAATLSSLEAVRILNHALRQGLELRLKAPYTAFTSAEILAHLQKNSDFSSDFQAECAEFLKTADRVLFAYQACHDDERRRWERQIGQWLNSMQNGVTL